VITAEVVAEKVREETRSNIRIAGVALILLGVLMLVVGAFSIPKMFSSGSNAETALTIIAIVSGLAIGLITLGSSLSTKGKANPLGALVAGLVGGMATVMVVMALIVLAFFALIISLLEMCLSLGH
jgi:hypothetical protein